MNYLQRTIVIAVSQGMAVGCFLALMRALHKDIRRYK